MDHVPGISSKLPRKFIKNASLDFNRSARDWTEIHWPDIAKAGAKAGAKADTARWIAVLPPAATDSMARICRWKPTS